MPGNKLYLVGSAIWSILREAASRGPSALADIVVIVIPYRVIIGYYKMNQLKMSEADKAHAYTLKSSYPQVLNVNPVDIVLL